MWSAFFDSRRVVASPISLRAFRRTKSFEERERKEKRERERGSILFTTQRAKSVVIKMIKMNDAFLAFLQHKIIFEKKKKKTNFLPSSLSLCTTRTPRNRTEQNARAPEEVGR